MKFTVPVIRISYQHHDIEIEAGSQEEADQIALDQAGNHLYDEKSVEYKLESELDNEASIKSKVEAALQGAHTMISDLSSGFPESELHQTPDEQLKEIDGAMNALGGKLDK